jgi:hypothetical protein
LDPFLEEIEARLFLNADAQHCLDWLEAFQHFPGLDWLEAFQHFLGLDWLEALQHFPGLLERWDQSFSLDSR